MDEQLKQRETMAKIEDKSFYVSITPYEHEGAMYDVLNVAAGYRKGRGFYANIHAGWKTDWGGYGCTFDYSGNPLSDTIWVDVKDSPKNSQKTIDVMAGALELAKDDIAYLFNERDWEHLKHLMKSVALYGYTPSTCEYMQSVKNEAMVKAHVRAARETINETSETKSEETMAQNMKAADLIGKVIIVGDNVASITIKSADGDMLQGEFKKGDAPAIAMPIKLAQLEKMLSDKVWKIQGEATATADDVEEVDEIVVEGPKTAETIDMKPKGEPKKGDKPKAKSEGRGKKSDVSHQPSTLKYETYTNKKGRPCARILGFEKTDDVYQKETAALLHGAQRPVDGEPVLAFGKAYVAWAKQMCDALNAGKSIEELKAMLEQYEIERAKPKVVKTYTEAEVADLLKRVIAGDKEAMEIVNAMSKAA